MINFRLFGYPVGIQPFFWLMCLMLGSNSLRTPGPDGIKSFLIWVGLVLVSILWHELGHAFARKKCGEPHSEIMLTGFGGYCAGRGNFTRHQSMFISFAGPLASFVLGALIWLLVLTPAISNPWVREFIAVGLWINIGWALINLLPVYPLDGGQIFAAFMSNKKPAVVPIVGMLVGGAIVAYGLMNNMIWMAIIFGMLTYQNWQLSQGRQTGGLF